MIVERLWPGNAYRNFHYLIACAETGEALAVDPLDADLNTDLGQALALVSAALLVWRAMIPVAGSCH